MVVMRLAAGARSGAAPTRLLDYNPAASCLGCWDLYEKLRRFDVRVFMNSVNFFQKGGAGWKHARRSGCGG